VFSRQIADRKIADRKGGKRSGAVIAAGRPPGERRADILARISHEISAPLNAILGLAETNDRRAVRPARQ